MFNLWRNLRLAGIAMMCVGAWLPLVQLIIYGVFVLLIGLAYGLTSVEHKLELLEKGDIDEKTDQN